MAETKKEVRKETAPKAAVKPAAKPDAKPTAEKSKTVKPAAADKKVTTKAATVKPAEKKVAVKAAAKPVAKLAAEESKVVKPSAKQAVVKKTETVKAEKPAKVKGGNGKLPYVSSGEIKVELVRGLAGCTDRQRKTVQALGLRKPNDAHVHKDNPAIRGMCQQVAHLVKVEKIS